MFIDKKALLKFDEIDFIKRSYMYNKTGFTSKTKHKKMMEKLRMKFEKYFFNTK